MPNQASAELAGAPSRTFCTQKLLRASTAMASAATGICLKLSRSATLSGIVLQITRRLSVPSASTACAVFNVRCSGGLSALTWKWSWCWLLPTQLQQKGLLCLTIFISCSTSRRFPALQNSPGRGHKAGTMLGGKLQICSLMPSELPARAIARTSLETAGSPPSSLPVLSPDALCPGAGPERVSGVPRAHQLHPDADAHEQRHAVHHLRQACQWRLGR